MGSASMMLEKFILGYDIPILSTFLSHYDYELPEALIAQVPVPNRGQSRLLQVHVPTSRIAHGHFSDIVDQFRAGDVLVLNDTKVLRARLRARRESGGAIEILLLADLGEHVWEAFIKPAKKVKEGDRLMLPNGLGYVCILEKNVGTTGKAPKHRIHLESHLSDLALIDACGLVPLPPYIHVDDAAARNFESSYQTVVASQPGAVAAPTAGLHFTQELLASIRSKGVTVCTVTLHVGYGTFQPIAVEQLDDHEMHEERYFISSEVADIVNQAKQTSRRIIAVGTTVVRTLESACVDGVVASGAGVSRLFIKPGYSFSVVTGMVTNFHLPKSSLLVMIRTFGGDDLMKRVYQEAIENAYRFFSFGDAMLILRGGKNG
jgi:S-adenosylmethionine:tRNA ribosyltransferase-isomerase